MPGTLLDRILFKCHHQFSWPRRTEEGQYYQVCLHCGVRYGYDWSRMRRLDRLNGEEPVHTAGPGKRPPCNTRVGWQPRERRLRWQVTMLYRADGGDWLEATTENISRSGLLFTVASPIEIGTPLELELEMPSEITGRAMTRVMAHAVVARLSVDKETTTIGASISDYRIVAAEAAS